jgi:hypothetical protein
MKPKKWTYYEIELLRQCGNKSIEVIKSMFPNRSELALRTKCSDYNIKILRTSDWTNEELNIIKNCNGKTMNEMLKLLPYRSKIGIRNMAFKYKISIRAERNWTSEEIKIINDANNKLTFSQTLDLLPYRTKYALSHYAKINNIKFRRPSVWKDEDIELLKNVCNDKTSLKDIYKLFPNIEDGVINKKIHDLGLRNLVTSHFKEWTNEEDNYLIENYYATKSKDLADKFKVVASGITERAAFLGLDKKLIQIPYTENEIQLLESIRNDCLSLNDICTLFSTRTIPSLRHMLKKLNIQYNRKDYYSSDGITKLRSIEERDVFDFIRDNFKVDIILSNGKKFKNKKYNESYIPDYIIHNVNNIILNKKLIIEYYGLYKPDNNQSTFIQTYIEKTQRKNEYYKSNPEIYFIDLYPTDLKNNFKGVKDKLYSFFTVNFNIDILKEAS